MFRRNRHVERRTAITAMAAKQVAKEIKVKIEPARDGPDEIFRLLQALDPCHQPVAGGVILQVKQRGDHRGSSGSTGGSAGGAVSAVARRKISSRLSSPADPENVWATSASVP